MLSKQRVDEFERDPDTGEVLVRIRAPGLVRIEYCKRGRRAFRFIWQNRIERWDMDPPIWGRVMAVASLLLWLSVAGFGRWIAYS